VENTTAWRRVWKEVAALLPTPGLRALHQGLVDKDPALTQGSTVSPPPLQALLDWPIEGGCLIVYGAWKSGEIETVGEAEEYFAKICYAVDRKLGEPAASRYLANWFDDAPRDEMRRELLAELDLVLFQRTVAGEEAPALAS
jgi:hypothetical protein